MNIKELPLWELFSRLQKANFPLGIEEYKLLIEALAQLKEEEIKDTETLKRLCCALWVKSPSDKLRFDIYFQQIVVGNTGKKTEIDPSIEPKVVGIKNKILDWLKSRLNWKTSLVLGSSLLLVIIGSFGLIRSSKETKETVKPSGNNGTNTPTDPRQSSNQNSSEVSTTLQNETGFTLVCGTDIFKDLEDSALTNTRDDVLESFSSHIITDTVAHLYVLSTTHFTVLKPDNRLDNYRILYTNGIHIDFHLAQKYLEYASNYFHVFSIYNVFDEYNISGYDKKAESNLILSENYQQISELGGGLQLGARQKDKIFDDFVPPTPCFLSSISPEKLIKEESEYHGMLWMGLTVFLGIIGLIYGGWILIQTRGKRPFLLSKNSQIIATLPTQLTPDYFPITQRQMKQIWRQARCLVRAGPSTELDVKATVKEISRQGFLLKPVLIPRRVNRTQLLLLIDSSKSMFPFQALCYQLKQTAQDSGRFEQTWIYYFDNVPLQQDQEFQLCPDFHCFEYQPIKTLLSQLHPNYGGVLIVSDGGAIRGGLNKKRLLQTRKFISQLREHTDKISWLNPLPPSRWTNTTAGEISKDIPMFELNRTGLETAISAWRKK